MKVKSLFFDFDGVIVESAGIKADAYKEVFKDESTHLTEIIDFYKAHHGLSRYKMFDLVYQEILRRPLSADEKNCLGQSFSETVMTKVIKCQPVKGSVDFLEHFSSVLPLFLLSATPTDELKHILRTRKLVSYFQEVHGSPIEKSEAARSIMKRYMLSPHEVTFIGDTFNDFHTALETDMNFIGRVPADSENPFPRSTSTIEDFTQLQAALD